MTQVKCKELGLLVQTALGNGCSLKIVPKMVNGIPVIVAVLEVSFSSYEELKVMAVSDLQVKVASVVKVLERESLGIGAYGGATNQEYPQSRLSNHICGKFRNAAREAQAIISVLLRSTSGGRGRRRHMKAEALVVMAIETSTLIKLNANNATSMFCTRTQRCT